MIAALFVEMDGPYFGINGIDPYPESRDARKYCGTFPVIAHPPCERWGSYWFGGPSAKTRRKLGDDGGCFKSALENVRRCGGVLEHPARSHAWKYFGINTPPLSGDWIKADEFGGFTCYVEQGHYGHPARKPTWLYAKLNNLIPVKTGPALNKIKIEESFPTNEARRIARASGIKPVKRVSKKELIHTPEPFVDFLILLVSNNFT